MIREISSVQLQGGKFTKLTPLKILESSDRKYVKASLIYGRNGSGKSTIARAFRKLCGANVALINTARVLDTTNTPIEPSDLELSQVFVFDEDFVTENVRIEGDGLGSIVMLGEQADLTAKITQAELELSKADESLKKCSDVLNEYNDETNPKSPQFYMKSMMKILKRDDGWAGRDSTIKGLRQNSRVSADTYKYFIELNPKKSRDDLIVEFSSRMKDLELAKTGGAIIPKEVPRLPDRYLKYSTMLNNDLITKKIERPELSEREKTLISLVSSEHADTLQTRLDYFKEESTTYCPYCLQDLTKEHKQYLIDIITEILTDEVKQAKDKLDALKLEDLTLDISLFSELPSYQYCEDLINKINNSLRANNALIQQKIDNLYSEITNKKLLNIEKECASLVEMLNRLEAERQSHNSGAVKTEPIKSDLTNINNQIAYYDIIEDYTQYTKQNQDEGKANQDYYAARSDQEQKKKVLEDLEGQRKCIDIAADIINNGLKYIFFAEDRLTLELEGDFYTLKSNGHNVLPKDVSVGERNIIGLCYFFASIMAGKSEYSSYNDECLIIIDDPLSSYDFENKIGILSFLRHKLSQYLIGNEHSRVVIMTHDLMSFFELEKMCQEFSAAWRKQFPGHSLTYIRQELIDCELRSFNLKSRHEYTELIKLIYDYGCGNAEEYNVVIGNIMRQALEAFATFEYRKGIEEVSNDETILSEMPDVYQPYFKNLMYRIVLNSGSHRQEQVQSMQLDFFSVISAEEKRRTAKEIICFIYLLNKTHILAHLGDLDDTINTLENWCGEIKSRAANCDSK